MFSITVLGYLGGSYDIWGKFQMFMEYNNDGDFLDADEVIYNSPAAVQGTLDFTFATPATVPVLDTWLRLRLIGLADGMDSKVSWSRAVMVK